MYPMPGVVPPFSQMFLHREEWEGEGLTGCLCRLWVIVSAAVPIYMKFGLPGLSSTVLSVPQGSNVSNSLVTE